MEKIYKRILDNKLKVGILIIVLLAIVGYGVNNSTEFELTAKRIDLEYGEALDDLETYIETTNIDESELEYNCDTISHDATFPEVGKHIVTYEYRGKSRELVINVKDTTPPKLTKLGDVNIIENDDVKYENYIEVDELSKYDFDVDDHEVKYSVAGTYNTNIKITDKYGNASKITIPVIINKLELEVSTNSLNLETNQGNKLEIKTNSNAPIKYSSSDETIAKVDNSGNITTLKAGNAIISASVNGRTVTCNVAVKDKEVPNTTVPVTDNNDYHQEQDNVSYTVYITKTGDCYHRGNCGYLSRSKISIAKDKALVQGYRACSRCNP